MKQKCRKKEGGREGEKRKKKVKKMKTEREVNMKMKQTKEMERKLCHEQIEPKKKKKTL